MKRILILVLAAAICLGSCTKKLDKSPYNSIPDEFAFNTEVDFGNAIKGMYTGMIALTNLGTPAPLPSFYGDTWNLDADVMADNVIVGTAGRGTRTIFHNWQYSGNNTSVLYSDGYVIIRRANAILANLDKLPAGAFKSNAQGEALAVRALIHFDMARMYCKAYTQAAASDPGLPYVVSLDPTLKPARGTVKELYDKVVADMEAAEPLINTSNGVGRLNKASVAGLLSRIYLYRGEWQKCVDAATRSLALNGNPATITEFPGIWTDATETGVLFKVKIQDNDNLTPGVNWSQTSGSGTRSEYVVDFAFYQLFQNNDVRKSAYIRTSAFGGFTYNHIAKYFGRATGRANVIDIKILRVAEILLNRAEAYHRLGGAANEALALADLDRLRTNRYTGFSSPGETGTALLDAIYLQRRLELAFESDRFFDLKRRGLGISRSNFGDYADGTGAGYVVKTLAANDPKFQLPIPQTEINVNPNIVQNP